MSLFTAVKVLYYFYLSFKVFIREIFMTLFIKLILSII